MNNCLIVLYKYFTTAHFQPQSYDHVIMEITFPLRLLPEINDWYYICGHYIFFSHLEYGERKQNKTKIHQQSFLAHFNPKRAGFFFVYLKSGGGGGGGGAFRAPPRISAAEWRKILKFGTYVELVNTHVLTKLQYRKSKRFWIMQIYVNYMQVFLFLIITDKMRPFRAFKLFWYCRRNI